MTNHSYRLIFIIFIQGVGYGFQSRLSLKDIIHQISHVKRERERERKREREREKEGRERERERGERERERERAHTTYIFLKE